MSKFLFCVAVAATLLVLALCICPHSPAADEKWTKKADMAVPRIAHSSVAVDGKIYVMGGTDRNQAFATIEEYDPETDTWKKKADMPDPGGLDGAVCAVDGKIYVIGRWPDPKASTVLNEVEEYDPKTEKWIKKTNMPTRRGHHAVCAVNGKIYAIGGYITGHVFASAVEEYDPETDTWTKKANMLTARAGFAAASVNGKVYAIGGDRPPWSDPRPLPIVEEYNPATDKWTRRADMPTARDTLTAGVVNGKLYAIGGWAGQGQTLSTVEEYDPMTDTWREVAPMPTARYWPSSSVVDGRIYVVGGSPGGGALLSTMEEYTPEGWQPKAVSPHGKLAATWGNIKQMR